MSYSAPLLTPSLVLLTGASGWLGRRIVLALTRGLADYISPLPRPPALRLLVRAGEALPSELRESGADIVFGDIRDPEALRYFLQGAQGAVLIHTAGIIHPVLRTEEFDAVNHRGTLALVQAARAAGIRRSVVVSSNSPVGYNHSPTDVFDEDSPFAPYMGYGRSKMRMELALRRLMDEGGRTEIVVARAPWFYGPEQPARQTTFFSMIRTGKFPIVGSGENRRSMAYVDTLAHGLLLCATHPAAANQTFWLADRSPYTMNEIVATVAEVMRDDFGLDVSSRSLRVPSLFADLARFADASLQAVGLYHQKVHVLSEMNLTIACTVERARRDLGFEPRIALREGMRRSIAWCLDHGIRI